MFPDRLPPFLETLYHPPPLHLCLSVWLMVWNIERCLFLLWLGRQGALWQTTRDQIDYAAFFFFCEVGPNVVIVSGLLCRPERKTSPGLMYLM